MLGTVVVGVFSTIISNQIQTREIEIKEQEANAKFLAQALDADVGARRRLSQYFSQVTRSSELRHRWSEYAKLVESEYQATLAEKKRLEEKSADQSLDAKTRDLLEGQVAELKRELSPRLSFAPSLPSRVYIHIRNETQRSSANMIAEALRRKTVLVPGVDLKELGPRVSELRYFRQAERDEAEQIASTVRDSGSPVSASYVAGYEASTGIRPRHFELWLAPISPAPRLPKPKS